MIGSRRQISLTRNVEKRHRFWGARELGSWQSIQIACRLQESVLEDTGRRVLHVARMELTARSHILVSWSVYPNYEYHYFSMYLVHLWLVKITFRLECISAAAKWSPGRQMRPIKRSGLFHVLPCVGVTTTSNYKAVPVGPFDRLIVFRWCTNGYGMMHKVWSSIGEVPHCFSKSSVKFQGHTGQEVADFYPNWVFPDCNSSLNSPMDLKLCTNLDTV